MIQLRPTDGPLAIYNCHPWPTVAHLRFQLISGKSFYAGPLWHLQVEDCMETDSFIKVYLNGIFELVTTGESKKFRWNEKQSFQIFLSIIGPTQLLFLSVIPITLMLTSMRLTRYQNIKNIHLIQAFTKPLVITLVLFKICSVRTTVSIWKVEYNI